MLASLMDRAEGLVIRADPGRASRMLGAMPASVLAGMQASRFRRTIRLVAERAPFYREAFRRRGLRAEDIRQPSDLGDFYTTGEDLRSCGPEAFIVGRPDTAFETTGTTSAVPKRVFFGRDELDAMGTASAAALHLVGLRSDDRVLSAFDCSFWVSPAVARSALQYIGAFHVEAGKIAPAECYERAAAYKPTVIFGEPSWIVRFADIAAARGTWPVKLLIVGGENMAETSRRHVERIWQAPVLLSYGQTEGFGSLGLECRQQNGFHRNDLHFRFEIREPDDHGYGELVYTTLTRHVMPLIRYRSGDVTKFVDVPCACGLFARRLARIRARCDEMVVCGMGNIGPWVFEELLSGVAYADEWQARIGHDGRVDVVTLEVERPADSTAGNLEAIVARHLAERFPDFEKNLRMELYRLVVIPLRPGTLRTARKLRRIVDERPGIEGFSGTEPVNRPAEQPS